MTGREDSFYFKGYWFVAHISSSDLQFHLFNLKVDGEFIGRIWTSPSSEFPWDYACHPEESFRSTSREGACLGLLRQAKLPFKLELDKEQEDEVWLGFSENLTKAMTPT